ncbi:aldo/keto reductase [Streptomonospora litoralis]|uniref:Oxidoreductase YdbC n=1 Tax=Streptomonospora litoralis TaxID=2498135 RepID=A0A4P6PVJ7_9ACTN|nr:aldo/keto reductase [Streptomonospora litoralis]QBI52246.1 Putative oxidoreductase YdbC [Streptomonospora litoralis]
MTDTNNSYQQVPGGTGTLGERRVGRIGYGAMQLWERDRDAAGRVLSRAVELGVDHIDTASFYGDSAAVNRAIHAALAPYPDDLALVSKVGARHEAGKEIPLAPAQHPDQLRAQVELDLRSLGTDHLTAVNLRRMDIGPGIVAEGDDAAPLDDQLAELIALRDEGKIGAIGLSNIGADQLQAALPAGIVCVQNAYSLLDRTDEALLETCREHGIAWVPYFPLGSAFESIPSVTDHFAVREVAEQAGATPAQVGLAWLLAHADNTLLIPGTGSVGHLEENVAAGEVRLSAEAMAALDAAADTAAAAAGRAGMTEG